MTTSRIRRATVSDRDELANLRAALWPEGSGEAHGRELDVILGTGMSGTLPMAAMNRGRLVTSKGEFVAEGWRLASQAKSKRK